MSERPRWFKPAVLAAAGLATYLVVRQFADSGSDDVVMPVARSAGPAGAGAAAPSAPAVAGSTGSARPADGAVATAPDLPTRSRISEAASKDPFAPKGWLPPPPPPPPPAAAAAAPPPPPPTAPPVPFRFVGLIEEKSAKPAAFIAKGDALFVVHVGDVVESTYRVESFNSAQVVVIYLPLQQRQTIEVTGG